MKRVSLIDVDEAAGLKLGQRLVIVPKSGPSARGLLVELDDQNLVIETAPGFEEVFRRMDITATRNLASRKSVE